MKYIFVAGAPGSKWSSVVKNIYHSPSIDRTDYRDERTYYHDASGELQIMHLGVYFDPGMEFGDWFDELSSHSKQQCEEEFDRPFSGSGVRIIKSHVFAHHIDFLKSQWPECPVVLVHRPDDSCLGWWVRCGHFNISYPSYHGYYKNLREMSRIINWQNRDIREAWDCYDGIMPRDNREMASLLKLAAPPQEYQQNYVHSDIEVKII